MSFETDFISQTKEKTPFADTPAQNFFAEWCRINDSIVPQFIPREVWERKETEEILEKEKNDQGKQTLFLPNDLHLWEMMDVIKVIDHDTLVRKPEKKDERADQIKNLGVTFEKAGIYLHQYLSVFREDDQEAKQIAEKVAREFYAYGLSLQHKEKKDNWIPQESELSAEDKSQLDEWFLGNDAFQKRLARLSDNPSEEQIEEIRKKWLRTYFKALAREGHKTKKTWKTRFSLIQRLLQSLFKKGDKTDGKKTWETKVGPMQHLQDRTRKRITKAIETPERELKTAIFRRGLEKLVTEMKEPDWRNSLQKFLREGCDLNLALEKVKLYNSLEIAKLKQELTEVRQTGDVTKISAKELEIAKKIQKSVSSFPYLENANNPSEIIENQFINCVGASILGGGLLDEVGIKYLHADLPKHSATVLITRDRKAYWQDFQSANYTEIRPDMLDEAIDFSEVKNFPDGGRTIQFKKWNPYSYINGKLRINLFNPEIGLQLHILNNTGNALRDLGRNEEAIEAFEIFIKLWEGDQSWINRAKGEIEKLKTS